VNGGSTHDEELKSSLTETGGAGVVCLEMASCCCCLVGRLMEFAAVPPLADAIGMARPLG